MERLDNFIEDFLLNTVIENAPIQKSNRHARLLRFRYISGVGIDLRMAGKALKKIGFSDELDFYIFKNGFLVASVPDEYKLPEKINRG